MFRKPKKAVKKSAFRSNQTKTDPTSTPFQNKRYRNRPRDSHSSSSDTDDDDNKLLEQARLFHQQNQKQSSRNNNKRIRTDSTSNKTAKHGVMHHYQSSSTHPSSSKELATREAEHHPQQPPPPSSSQTSTLESNTPSEPTSIPNQYKGNNTTKRNKFLAGPIRAPTFVRTTCRFDYQPDICKDYKETGFCGFGDTCIYLHDRGDTLSGWQMEKEWEDRKKREQEEKSKALERFARVGAGGGVDAEKDGEEKEGDVMEDGLPYACIICRNAFHDPVVTNCGHYFCQTCVMKRVTEDGTTACPVCNGDTHGVFNHPSKLHAKKRRVVGLDGTWEEFRTEMLARHSS